MHGRFCALQNLPDQHILATLVVLCTKPDVRQYSWNYWYLCPNFENLILRVFHIIFALLLFISSTGLVINRHYCQNELKSKAVFLKAQPCHQKRVMSGCPNHDPMQKGEDKDCCKDKTEYLKLDQDQIIPNIDLRQAVFPLIAPVVFTVLSPTVGFYKKSLHYLNYKPPLLVCDLPVRFQTFLL